MAGTETALNSNYKSATQAFYDARAGVEEGRGRLWTGHPNALGGFVTVPGTTMGVGQVRYILNPAGGEAVPNRYVCPGTPTRIDSTAEETAFLRQLLD